MRTQFKQKKGKIRACTEMLIFNCRCKLQLTCVSSSKVTTIAAQKTAKITADETWLFFPKLNQRFAALSRSTEQPKHSRQPQEGTEQP